METKHTPIMDRLTSIDNPLLTDTEYDQLKQVGEMVLKNASKGLAGAGADFERIYSKGYANGYVAALANFPELARELIAKANQ